MRFHFRVIADVGWWLSFLLLAFGEPLRAETSDRLEPQTFSDNWSYFGQSDSSPTLPFSHRHTKRITGLASSVDGEILAVVEDDRAIAIRNAQTGAWLRRLSGFAGNIASVTFHPDNKRLVVGCLDGSISEWNVTSGERERTFQTRGNWVTSVAFTPDRKLLVAGDYDKSVKIWDYESTTLVKTVDAISAVRSLVFSNDGTMLAAGCVDGVRMWKTEDWSLLHAATDAGPINIVALSPSGKWLAGGADHGNVYLWDTQRWDTANVLIAHPYLVTSLKFTQRENSLVSGAADGKIIVWNTQTRQLRQVFEQHRGAITGLVLLPKSRALITASVDRTIKVRLGSVPDLLSLPLAERRGKLMGLSPDGQSLAVLEGTNRIQLIRASTGEAAEQFENDSPVRCLEFAGNKALVAASTDGQIRMWDVPSRRVVSHVTIGAPAISCLDVSSDGKRLAVGTSNGVWRMFDLADPDKPRQVSSSPVQSLPITNIAFSPDDRWIVTAVNSPTDWRVPGEAKLWVAATGEQVGTLGQHASQLHGFCFDNSGKRIATFGDFSAVRIWEVETRRELAGVNVRANVASAAFTADDRGLVIARSEGMIDCWSIATQTPTRKLDGHSFPIAGLWVSQDRRVAASCDLDSTVKIWSIEHDAAGK